MKCPKAMCAEREIKELYVKAKIGEIETLTGLNSEYHPPEKPFIVIENDAPTPRRAINPMLVCLHQSRQFG